MATTTDKKTDKKLGWHFLPKDMKLEYNDGRKAVVGQTLSMQGTEKPRRCHVGMHASTKISDAAGFNKGLVLTRVEVSGDLDVANYDEKFCGRNRKVLWAKEITALDANEIGKALGCEELTKCKKVDVYRLSNAASNYDEFDDVMQAWAKKHGCPGIKAQKLGTAKPRITGKDILGQLDTRTVSTKHEILQRLGRGNFNMKPRDSYNDDSFAEAIDDISCRIHVIENFTKSGASGYLRISRK